MTGDETIVPHKGKKSRVTPAVCARKPHKKGLKLYCLADGVRPYMLDIHFYWQARVLDNPIPEVSGKAKLAEMVYRWAVVHTIVSLYATHILVAPRCVAN